MLRNERGQGDVEALCPRFFSQKEGTCVSEVKAFIFDMDGLLVETESLQIEAFDAFLRLKGIEPPDELGPSLIGVSIRNNIIRIKEELGLEGETDVLVEERNALYLEMLSEAEIEVMEGVGELFEFAVRHGVKTAVCTSSDRRQLEAVMPRVLAAVGRREGPEEFFAAMVCGDDVEHLKPVPDIYLLSAERLGLTPAGCVAFEDSPAGAESAACAGMQVVVVPNRIGRQPESWPTRHVFGSLGEVLESGALRAEGDCVLFGEGVAHRNHG